MQCVSMQGVAVARSSREGAARTWEAILEAATHAFGSQGYSAVSLEGVANSVGVTRGALYNRYPNKRTLFEAVLERVMSSVRDRVEAAVAPGASEMEQLRYGATEFVRASVEPVTCQIMLIDAPAVLGWSRWRELDAQHSRRGLAEGLLELSRDGQLDPSSVDAAAALLSGALNEAALWATEQPELDHALEQIDRNFARMLDALVTAS